MVDRRRLLVTTALACLIGRTAIAAEGFDFRRAEERTALPQIKYLDESGNETDLSALKADFTLEAAPDADGLQWVLASPKTKDGQLKSVRVGFAGEQLAALDILDSFGQRSLIRFNGMQANAALPASTFQFKPPAGADVVKQ